jgi:hypothetical protein
VVLEPYSAEDGDALRGEINNLALMFAGAARGSPLVAEADWGPVLIALAVLPFIVR